MAWIESHTQLRNHPKLITFCRELKIDRAQAIGHLHMFWWWAIEQREDGDLIGTFEREIANAADWPGNPKRLLKALQKANFVSKDMKIVDWLDYVGRLIRDRERKRLGRIRGHSADEGKESPHIPNRTVPYRTEPDRKNQKPGLFSKAEEKVLLNLIAQKRSVGLESMSASLRLIEIKEEISKLIAEGKCDNPMAMARHKASNQ